MSICQSCGGVIGRDRFNPQECMEITQDLAERGERAAMEQQSMLVQIAALEQRNAELEAALKLLLCHSHCSEHQRLIIYRALEKEATP